MTNKSRHAPIEFEIYHANLCLLNSQIMAIAYCTLRIISDSLRLTLYIYHENTFEICNNIIKHCILILKQQYSSIS